MFGYQKLHIQHTETARKKQTQMMQQTRNKKITSKWKSRKLLVKNQLRTLII